MIDASDDDPQRLLPPSEPVRLLEPDGTLREHPDFPLRLESDQLRDLYRRMVVTRRVDREAINLQRQGQLALHASGLGQEGAQIGSALALADEDWVFPSYRELGVAMVRGVAPAELLHVWRGTWLGCHDPYRTNFAFMAIPIATQALHAAGFAMGARLDANPIAAVAYVGDGATSEGDFHEACNFAAVYQAPCIFFVQNNQYAISVSLEQQTHAPTLAHKAVGYGMPGYRCDGNDVLATLAVTRHALARARAGAGPALIEAMTYRMEAHTTSDDPTRYRTAEELEEAARTDPIARMRNLLEREGLLDEDLEAAIEDESRSASAALREAVYEAPHGEVTELFEHVYVDRRGHLEDHEALLRAELDAEVAGEGEG